MDWTFGTFLESMLVFFIWFAAIWIFVAVCADILRSDMSGWAKAGWIVLIVFLPLIGILIYLIARPKDARSWSPPSHGYPVMPYAAGDHLAADEIRKASQLREEGIITTAEYERMKQQALNR